MGLSNRFERRRTKCKHKITTTRTNMSTQQKRAERSKRVSDEQRCSTAHNSMPSNEVQLGQRNVV